jgi:hypothetical protein
MIRVKMLKGNEVAIIDNGKSYIFNSSGICYKEDAGLIPQYTTGMIDLPIISVLSSNGKAEIGLFSGESIRLFEPEEDAMTCAMKIQMSGKIVRMLRRDGKVENTRFNQLLLVYSEGTDLISKLDSLNVKEIQH